MNWNTFSSHTDLRNYEIFGPYTEYNSMYYLGSITGLAMCHSFIHKFGCPFFIFICLPVRRNSPVKDSKLSARDINLQGCASKEHVYSIPKVVCSNVYDQ